VAALVARAVAAHGGALGVQHRPVTLVLKPVALTATGAAVTGLSADGVVVHHVLCVGSTTLGSAYKAAPHPRDVGDPTRSESCRTGAQTNERGDTSAQQRTVTAGLPGGAAGPKQVRRVGAASEGRRDQSRDSHAQSFAARSRNSSSLTQASPLDRPSSNLR
jgi:hypothetical protein